MITPPVITLKYKAGSIIAGADHNYKFLVVRIERDSYGAFHYLLETLSYKKEILSKVGDREHYLVTMVDEGSYLVRPPLCFNKMWCDLNA